MELLRGLVAVSSVELDEGKAGIYAEAGIPEYWIVQPEQRTVTVYGEPAGDRYQARTVLSEEALLRCAALPGVEFPVASILPPRS